MARFTFNTKIALMFNDANIAALFDNLCFWIAHNKVNHTGLNQIEIEGQIVERTFTFNSIQAFCDLYPFWTKKQIETYLTKLRNRNLIVKATFNKKGFDRTSWYCLVDESWLDEFIPHAADKKPVNVTEDEKSSTDEEKEDETEKQIKKTYVEDQGDKNKNSNSSISPKGEIDTAKKGNAFPQNGRPIPDITSFITTDIKRTAAALKDLLVKINESLVFDDKFYPAAAAFLNKYNLDQENYSRWLFDETTAKKPSNLRSYYYTVYTISDNAMAYLAYMKSKKESGESCRSDTRKFYVCPVCGNKYDTVLVDCPDCGFRFDDRNDSRKIDHEKKVRQLSNKLYAQYQHDLMGLYQKNNITDESLAELDGRYGITQVALKEVDIF